MERGEFYGRKDHFDWKWHIGKEFKIDARGYRLQEVDKFLDIIIGDYTNFHKIIAKYDNELKSVMEENIRLKMKLEI